MECFVEDYDGFLSANNVTAHNCNNGFHFAVEDLLDFSNEYETMADGIFDCLTGNSGDSSTVTAVDSCNSLVSGCGDGQFNGNLSCRSFNESPFSGAELCVPCDDLAELEWLSNFVEESFSTDDLHHFMPATTSTAVNNAATDSSSSANTSHSPPIFPSNISIPGKARSKRSRAAPCDWSSRLLLLSPSSNPKTTPSKKGEPTETPVRKCLHCASLKTPQWRTGPMGPKTLCNACGVRYKSGRLVPEYRPASSPTFVPVKHSNSHRKVLELRRQKELNQQQMINQPSIFNAPTVAMIS